MSQPVARTTVFEQLRRRLFSLAYQMLGTRADAEDVVQDAYVRWHQTDQTEVRTPEAWLVSVVTRLSIDRLRKVSLERQDYIGPWLPEPLLVDDSPSPQQDLELKLDLSLAFVAMLEKLAPVERAAFLLHDIFDCAYPVIADILSKSETACRQVVHRARERVRSEHRRYKASDEERRKLIETFIAAANASDEKTLLSLFATDATLTSDGGGVVAAARRVVHGRSRIARLYAVISRKLRGRIRFEAHEINGHPGLIIFVDNQILSASTFETDGTSIRTLFTVLNPTKLNDFNALAPRG
jgi:RNA polymerase sigma-70 factor, ECF subfamily